MRSAPSFQLVTTPSRFLLTIASSLELDDGGNRAQTLFAFLKVS